ncbi:sensor histidine kinase [Fundidesulfovibrio agrisoli]|uniref:sensor histidine kinase n=1 Tax=Fundidesulfovibrio agrisoli TaxID=2922717 RepID=UPI001FACF03F|nr:HAMP domain-containing sensor histidine kinase [Fundidesulfovibrio agrisoli]
MKFVSWGTLVLTLLSSLFLSIFLANYARQVLLSKQHEFARLWAETLNHNISRRFSVPVFLRYGEVNLADPAQYKLLDDVVRSVLEDFPVQDIRIYDLNGVVGYALDRSLVGREGLGGEALGQAMSEGKLTFEFLYQTGPLGAMFSAEIAPRSVVMRTVAPLRFKVTFPGGRITPNAHGQSPPGEEQGPGPAGEAAQESKQAATPEAGSSSEPAQPATEAAPAPGAAATGEPGKAQAPEQSQSERAQTEGATAEQGPGAAPESGKAEPQEEPTGDLVINEVIGALEFTQDITADYQKLVTFQRIIILAALISAFLLFFVLRMLIHRADRLNAQRLLEREAFEREIMQNEKLVSMGRMVAGIAHEIRNPLGIIRSSSELLVTRVGDKDQLTTRILQAINEEAVRLSKTVGDFLDYARPRALNLSPVDLGQLLDQALTFLEQKFREQGVEMVKEYAPGVVVQADKDLLYRALYNILVNALEAMAGQKPSETGAEAGGVRGQIVVRLKEEGGKVLLTFLDTGPGIPADIRDKLLDPFFTTKESGTGLGLAITANILRSHGASIALGDNPEGGARVDIVFSKP